MSKVIYEYYYVVGSYSFSSCYDLVVDKETNKMLYGNIFYPSGVPYNKRFAINKNNLNQIYQIKDEHHGLVYRVQVESDDRKNAEQKARKIIYNRMIDFVNAFINCEED